MTRQPLFCVLAALLGACCPAAAQVPASSSASEPVSAMLSPGLGEAVGRVQSLLADPNDAAIQTTFSPEFLAAIPPDKVKDIFTHAKEHLGSCTKERPVQVQGETSAIVRIECERGALTASLVINPMAPHLLDYLLLKAANP